MQHSHASEVLPFCLSWANENWTHAWDGGESPVWMDAAVEFQPDWWEFGAPLGSRNKALRSFRWNDLRFFLGRKLFGDSTNLQDYSHLVSSMSKQVNCNPLT